MLRQQPHEFKIQNSEGEYHTAYAQFCPKCSKALPRNPEDAAKFRSKGGQDFDENGWFTLITTRCPDPRCTHTWVERFRH